MGREADDPTVIQRQQMDKDGIRNCRTTMKADVTFAEREAISNLLAVIHRDGGHYEAKHGLLKAVEDAEKKVQTWRKVAATILEIRW